MKIGPNDLGGGRWEFTVWAPFLKKVELKMLWPEKKVLPMDRDEKGYWKTVLTDIPPDTRYFYRLEARTDRPDPASPFQPEGVHGPSQVVDHLSFRWEDGGWKGIDLSEMILYELHVGTFTPEGTFEAILSRLEELKDMGITALEIMPVAQFPGKRNWGYDGAYPFAVQNSYGGPEGFKRLVNRCHQRGIAVVLDVVHNHLGPEGNYLSDFGPYFTGKYSTPWGGAINFDEAYSDEVRNFFIENVFHWFKNYHLDALRLDAVHAIFDRGAGPFLGELAERVERLSKSERKPLYLIAESNLNDPRVIKPRELGGFGIDAQWCDDFHHALHALLTREDQGYYMDFGKVAHLVKALKDGFVYTGQYSQFRKRSHGNSSKDRPAHQFIVFSQNHDQIGNRLLGERLSQLTSFEGLKLAAGIVILSPYVPLLFMGEEYGEEVPFLYFVSHSDPDLVQAVRAGRKEEFKHFAWRVDPPDPQEEGTFLRSKLNWEKREDGNPRVLLNFYKDLIRLRREIPALSNLDKDSLEVCGFEAEKLIFMRRWKGTCEVFYILNLGAADVNPRVYLPEGRWRKILDSSDRIWNGPGTFLPESIRSGEEVTVRGHGLALYLKEEVR